MLCGDFKQSHPEESAAAKQMAKVGWTWVELLTGMLLWQYRDLALIRLKNLLEVAVKMQRLRHTDRDFLEFFQQVRALQAGRQAGRPASLVAAHAAQQSGACNLMHTPCSPATSTATTKYSAVAFIYACDVVVVQHNIQSAS